jgi:hypothetical protein
LGHFVESKKGSFNSFQFGCKCNAYIECSGLCEVAQDFRVEEEGSADEGYKTEGGEEARRRGGRKRGSCSSVWTRCP